MKAGLCNFSGVKIYPGHGQKVVLLDSKNFTFVNSKTKSFFLKKRNPRVIRWTQIYRRLNKKGQIEEVSKRRTRRSEKVQRGITTASLDVIKEQRSQKPEVRQAAREQALRELKEKKKKLQKEKAAKKAPAKKK